MKRQLQKMGALSAGVFCATQALAGWTDVADDQEMRAVQASSALHGRDIYGHRFVGTFDADGRATLIVNGARMSTLWHFNGRAELCVEWQEGTECFRMQKSDSPPPGYRALRVRDGQTMPILAVGERLETLGALSR